MGSSSDPPEPVLPDAWAMGLSPPQRYEWLVDCYRLRVDDDYVQMGVARGCLNPEAGIGWLAHEFLTFCKLAVEAMAIPPKHWSWPRFLRYAGGQVGYAFEKSDADAKYAGEGLLAPVAMGGRSLRHTGELIYGHSAALDAPDEVLDVLEGIEMEVDACFTLEDEDEDEAEELAGRAWEMGSLVVTPDTLKYYEEVGGAAAWLQFWAALSASPGSAHCDSPDPWVRPVDLLPDPGCELCGSGEGEPPEGGGGGLKWCTGCRGARYCGPECQKRDWKAGHREECKNA